MALALIYLELGSLLMPMMFGHMAFFHLYRNSIEEVREIQWNHS
jgi:hypothetical protein